MRHARSVFFGDRLRRQLADRPQLADGVATLLDEPERWIRRRVERIDVERLDEAGSSVSLDAWLEPAIAADVAFDGGERLLVPVGYGIKGGRLAQFDLTADGTPAALLSFPENVVLSAAVLDVLCARHGLSGAVSRAELEVLCGPSAASAGVATALRDAAAALPDARAREAVERWVGVFERRYVLYASIPHDDGRAQRQLRVAQTKQRPAADTPSRSFAGLAEAPGTGDVVVGLKTTDVGFGARYHLDLGTADELEIVAAQLRALDDDGRPRRGADGAPVPLAQGRGRNRVSLDPAVRIDPLERTEVLLFLRPERRAFSREATPISAVLAIATLLAAVPPVFDAAVPAGLSSLLLAPAAAAFALGVRSYPQEITRDALRQPQAFLGVQVIVLLAAIGLLAVSQFDVLAAVNRLPGLDLSRTLETVAEVVVFAALLAVSAILLAAQVALRRRQV